MSMENLGPYTNFHELNQDWFLQEFNKLVAHWIAMQKNFDSLQDAFNDLKNYVQDYFKNLDLQEEINNKLDEMIESGEFTEILNKLFKNKFTFEGVFEIYDYIKYFGYYAQGICSNDKYHFISATKINTNSTLFMKYSKETKSLVGVLQGNYYHANSLVFNENTNEIYSLNALEYSNDKYVSNSNITVIDAETLTFKREITTNIEYPSAIGINKNKLYVIASNKKVYNVTDNNILCTLNYNVTGTWQGGTIDDNFIYLITSRPNYILLFTHDGNFYGGCSLVDGIKNLYNLYEIEDIVIYNNTVYLLNNDFNNSNNIKTDSAYNRINVFKCPLFGLFQTTYNKTNTFINQIYVNKSFIGIPDGSENKPFTDIDSALNLIKACRPGKFNIILQSTVEGNVIIENICGCDIRITNGKIDGSFKISDGNISFNNLEFITSDPINFEDGTANVFINSTKLMINVVFNNVTFSNECTYNVRCLNSSGLINFNDCKHNGPGIVNISGGGIVISTNDNGTYRVPDNNVFKSSIYTSQFKGFIGNGRHVFIDNLSTIKPNVKTKITDDSILANSTIKITFDGGNGILMYGDSKSSISNITKIINGVFYILRVSVTIDDNSLTWNGIKINLTDGTYENITSENFINITHIKNVEIF